MCWTGSHHKAALTSGSRWGARSALLHSPATSSGRSDDGSASTPGGSSWSWPAEPKGQDGSPVTPQPSPRAFDDIDVVAICGRNRRLERRLASVGCPRLTVKGFVDNMADWYRAADLVVTKAGPQTIAEATCCGAALLVTSHLPGQERGNTELVVRVGAGAHTPRVEDVVRAVAHLKGDPDALGAMRRASSALARPDAAHRVASLVAGLTSSPQKRLERRGAA